MKQNKDIQELLYKFISNKCDEAEIQKLVAYFRKGKNDKNFPQVEETLRLITKKAKMEKKDAEKIYSEIMTRAQQQEINAAKPKIPMRKVIKYAAVAVILVGITALGYWFQPPSNNLDQNNSIVSSVPEPIILKLGNGNTKLIKETDTAVFANKAGNIIGTQHGSQLTYDAGNYEHMVYNTLKVPYGRKFQVELSDGTLVHLNSGTTIKYPVVFLEGQKRQVFLSGEAYFDVAKDKSRPFIVNAGELKVEVFGTKFNVTAYPENPSTNVVLVEGSVGMYMKGKKDKLTEENLLQPGFKGSFNKKREMISKTQVETNVYTSWMNGELVFRNLGFEDILRKLERHYNVRIVNKNKMMATGTYSANFGKEPIEKVLQYLKTSYNIEFIVQENKIIIQ